MESTAFSYSKQGSPSLYPRPEPSFDTVLESILYVESLSRAPIDPQGMKELGETIHLCIKSDLDPATISTHVGVPFHRMGGFFYSYSIQPMRVLSNWDVEALLPRRHYTA